MNVARSCTLLKIESVQFYKHQCSSLAFVSVPYHKVLVARSVKIFVELNRRLGKCGCEATSRAVRRLVQAAVKADVESYLAEALEYAQIVQWRKPRKFAKIISCERYSKLALTSHYWREAPH